VFERREGEHSVLHLVDELCRPLEGMGRFGSVQIADHGTQPADHAQRRRIPGWSLGERGRDRVVNGVQTGRRLGGVPRAKCRELRPLAACKRLGYRQCGDVKCSTLEQELAA
jgi:hypothetical protein